jgi:hypothetical protein
MYTVRLERRFSPASEAWTAKERGNPAGILAGFPGRRRTGYFFGASTGLRSNFPLDTTKMMQSLAASHFVTCFTPWGWYS